MEKTLIPTDGGILCECVTMLGETPKEATGVPMAHCVAWSPAGNAYMHEHTGINKNNTPTSHGNILV